MNNNKRKEYLLSNALDYAIKNISSETLLEVLFIVELQQAFDRNMTRAETATYLKNVIWNKQPTYFS